MNVPVGVQTPTGNILHVAPQTRDLASYEPGRVHQIPDQHRTIEVVLRSIREDGWAAAWCCGASGITGWMSKGP